MTKIGDVSTKTGRRKVTLNEGERSTLRLTPHDINVISIAAMKPSMDHKQLFQMIVKSRPSTNAMDIVKIILLGERADQVVKQGPIKVAIANNYLLWANSIKGAGEKRTARSKKGEVAKRVSKKTVAKKAASKSKIKKAPEEIGSA